ncbi:MAG TPA: alpha/beta hydrolase [Candidatus Paceibacterota bacterium]
MRKIVYIIPGYEVYKPASELENIFKKEGFEPIFVPIRWDRKRPAQFKEFVQDFLKVYRTKPKGVCIYVFGFSLGALVAFLAAGKIRPDGLILASLSSWFAEDLETLDQSWSEWWQKNFSDKPFSFQKLVPRIKSKTVVLVGSTEDKDMINRARETAKRIPHTKLITVKGVGHKILHKDYLNAVKKAILYLV